VQPHRHTCTHVHACKHTQVVEANFKRMEQANREMHMQSQETRHTNEMLFVDKAYLSQQVTGWLGVGLPQSA